MTDPTPKHQTADTEEYQRQEKICTQAAMAQWEASLKRPDLDEKDRVYGAIATYKRQAFVFNVCQPAEPQAPEPFAAVTYDLTGCEHFSRDVALIEKIADAGSNGPTEVTYLYVAPSREPQTADLHIATVAEMGVGGIRVLLPHPPGSADHLPVGTKLFARPQNEMLRLAVAAVLEADKEFRSNMMPGWEGDPLSDEIDGLRRIFEASPTPKPQTSGRPHGHCDDDSAWDKFSKDYGDRAREDLCKGNMTDFALANAQFMCDRDSLDLIVFQTAAKERIRWLSIQLARALGASEGKP